MLCFEECQPCQLQDYDAFLAVAFAVNTSISAWWSWVYRYLIDLGQRNKDKLTDEKVPPAMYVRETDRDRVDEVTRWFSRFTRVLSFIIAVTIMLALLFLRATTTLHFWCVTAVGIICPLLTLLAVVIHHHRMRGIEKREKEIHGVLEKNAKSLALTAVASEEKVNALPKSQQDWGFFIWVKNWGSIFLTAAIVGTLLAGCLWFHRPTSREAACPPQIRAAPPYDSAKPAQNLPISPPSASLEN